MWQKMSVRFWLVLSILLPVFQASSTAMPAKPWRSHVAAALAPAAPITIIPDQMQFTGDVTTQANCASAAVCALLDGTPAGTIMLGVDPNTTDRAMWDGGTATVVLPVFLVKTLLVMEVKDPALAERGIYSSIKGRVVSIQLDGKTLWDKRTDLLLSAGKYFALENEALVTTLVLSPSVAHTLTFFVPPTTAWDISLVQLTESPLPATYRGIGYSPYRDCQYPGGTRLPSNQDIQEDLFRLVNTSNAIRTYSALGPNAQVPALANQIGLPVFPGAWIDYPKTTTQQDDAEIQGLINLACSSTVEGVIVGNEYYLRHRSTEAINYLIGRIQQVKTGIQAQCGKTVPVTTAEIDDLIFQFSTPITYTASLAAIPIQPNYQPVIDELDFVMEHIYPYWSGLPIEGAAAYTVERFKQAEDALQQAYPGQNKWLIIGEAGWPSAGEGNGAAAPNTFNQSRYLLEFLRLTAEENIPFLYFDAFDELWKIEEPGGVGKHWGYSYTDRTAKYNFYSVLIPPGMLPAPLIPEKVYIPTVHSVSSLPVSQKFPVFSEWPEGPGHFVPSGWMGDIENIEMNECYREDPHSGEMAVKVTLSTAGELGWGGVYWQYPENNWGSLPDSLDLSWANKVTFWAKGETGSERVRFFVGGIGIASDPYHDSLRPAVDTGFIQLTPQWKQYTINLAGQDLSHMIGGFGWAADRCADPAGATFYLDDIYFEHEPNLQPPPPYSSPFKLYSDAGVQDNHFIPSGWLGDATVAGRLDLTECWLTNPHLGNTCIRIDYAQEVIGWAGVYWMHPAANWGDRPGGINLQGAARLTFWARSETPNLPVKFIIGGVGYAVDYQGDAICSQPIQPYPDSVCPKVIAAKNLGTQWTQYTITLPNRDYRRVVGGFGLVMETPGVIYLDDIAYEW